jgi:hypothetical protein
MPDDQTITKAVIQAILLGWSEFNIINLVAKEYRCQISTIFIEQIKEDYAFQIEEFHKQLVIGKSSIHKRLIKYAKKNSLNYHLLCPNKESINLLVITRLIQLINKFNKISYIQVNNLYIEYYGKTHDDLNIILAQLDIPSYQNFENYFIRSSGANSEFENIDAIEHFNSVYKIIYNDRIFLDTVNNELHVSDEKTALKFLITALTLCELKSDPKIREFFNEIISRS